MVEQHQDYFNELREQLFNEDKWRQDKFVVFGLEAGSGKSREVKKYLAEMATTTPYRAVYVQLFKKNDELDNTVDTINKLAGKTVAVGFVSGDSKPKGKLSHAIQMPVLCVTHEMFFRFCLGEHRDLWSGRDVMIIDEFPNFMHPLCIGEHECSQFLYNARLYGKPDIQKLADGLATKHQNLKRVYSGKTNEIPFVRFSEWTALLSKLEDLLESPKNLKDKWLVENIHHVIQNGAYFFEGKFQTYNFRIRPLMLRNNLILDANGSFDYRYQLSPYFEMRTQEKLYDYSSSQIIHYDIDTSKSALSTYQHFTEDVLNEISLEGFRKVLFVTDLGNEEEVKKTIAEKVKKDWQSEKTLPLEVSVDHFGALLGVNTYRDYDGCVILKTPYFSYISYLLNDLYYGHEGRNVMLFGDPTIETVRKRMVSGEIYQAIARVARDHDQPMKVYVFCNNQEAIDTVAEQFPRIQYVKRKMTVSVKRGKRRVKEDKQERVGMEEQIIGVLCDFLQSGDTSISKKQVRDKVGMKSTSYLNLLIREKEALSSFIQENNIHNKAHDFCKESV